MFLHLSRLSFFVINIVVEEAVAGEAVGKGEKGEKNQGKELKQSRSFENEIKKKKWQAVMRFEEGAYGQV